MKYKGTGNNPNSRKNLKPCKPGEIRNPVGKLKGTRDKITLIRNTILNAFDPVAFKKWTQTEQTEYMKTLIKIMPQELKIEGGLTIDDSNPEAIDQKVKAAMIRLGYTKKKG